MKTSILMFFAAALLLAAVSPWLSPNSHQAYAYPPGVGILSKAKNCLACHSISGKGGKQAPAFDELGKYISPLFMAQALWNHGPEMEKQIRKMLDEGNGAIKASDARIAGVNNKQLQRLTETRFRWFEVRNRFPR